MVVNTSYTMLNKEIQNFIAEQKWPKFTSIQDAAIQNILSSNDNFILAAPTASGKTEAAFFPTINAVKEWKNGVKIIYISPLIALINDQFERVTRLCNFLNVKVTRWHGEASQSQKKKLLRQPEGIILITPESIEAMFVNHPGYVETLFSNVDFILVDEIHSFLTSNRGIQLQSLLERLQLHMKKTPRYIGMSATLSESGLLKAKKFFPNNHITKVIVDNKKNKVALTQNFFPENTKKQSIGALNKIYGFSQNESMLIFPNSRESVEYLTVNLIKLAQNNQSDSHYFAHHASLTKQFRSKVEEFAKNSRGKLFTICCTSTLELGIDIGAVDSVVQYNSPFSVSSLAQRLGRSGRRTKQSILHFIATNPWDLLQGLAIIELYQDGNMDNFDGIKAPYDVCAHQMLSMLIEQSEIKISEFKHLNQKFSVWSTIDDDEFKEIAQHLLDQHYIEKEGPYFITGLATDKLLCGPDFYTQFKSAIEFQVISPSGKVGSMRLGPDIVIGSNFFLAGKVWKVWDIKMKEKKIFVKKAVDGNPPIFHSTGSDVETYVRQKMENLLYDSAYLNRLEEPMREQLEKITTDVIDEKNPYLVDVKGSVGVRTFVGTKVNRALMIMFNIVNDTNNFILVDKETLLYTNDLNIDIKGTLKKACKRTWNRNHLEKYLEKDEFTAFFFLNDMKYLELVPKKLQIRYIVDNLLDLEGAVEWMERFSF